MARASVPLLLLGAAAVGAGGWALLSGGGGRAGAPPPGAEGAPAFALRDRPDAVRHSVPLDEVRLGIRGRPPRDAIPAVTAPRFVPLAEASFLPDDGRVLVLDLGGPAGRDVRAYPVHVLDRHEVVDDVVGGRPVVVTWCPLCGSAVAYDRRVGGRTLAFGVSGYLFESDLLMYDRETESFWSQMRGEAVVGPLTGARLVPLPVEVMTAAALRRLHAEARVLSEAQGLLPPDAYRGEAYPGYAASDRLAFPVSARSARLPPKAEVVGVEAGGAATAFPLADLRALDAPLRTRVGGVEVVVTHDAAGDRVTVRDGEGRPRPAVRCYWFAWYAFHPATDVWERR